MAEKKSTRSRAKSDVDGDLVRRLAQLLDETGLTEIEYGSDGWHVRVVKGTGGNSPAVPSATEPAADTGAAPDYVEGHPGLVTSPMVGVVFTAPEPGLPPFVKVGDQVIEGQPLLLIEAMKVFNPIAAPRAGRVSRILVGNGVPVEYGEPLMIIE